MSRPPVLILLSAPAVPLQHPSPSTHLSGHREDMAMLDHAVHVRRNDPRLWAYD